MKFAKRATLMSLCLAIAPVARANDRVPTLAEVRQAHRPSDLLLLDRHGEPLQSVRVDATQRRLAWLPLAQFSPALRELAVQGEDKRFWSHGGVDWSAAARSAWSSLRGGSNPGASTISMQLAALLNEDLARPAGGRSLGGKLDQMGAARALEARWTKPEILEAWLNRVPLRGELVGMPAGAWALFGKQAAGLDRAEAALLVALVRAPNAKDELVVRRACALLAPGDRSAAAGHPQGERDRHSPGPGNAAGPGCEAVAGLAARVLPRRAGPPLTEPLAPHFARWWLARPDTQAALRQGAATLRTPLDARLQRAALAQLRGQMAELQGRGVEDGAVLVLDNASGEPRAWVGSTGARWSDAPEVDAVLARRQPGSTLKPFVYALAFQQGLLTPASLLHDAPADLEGGGGAFMPRNYDHRYRGWVSARAALAASLNVPAARVGVLVGPEPLFEVLNRAGLALDHDGGWHGLALALGSADVTLLQLANAYRMLANGGRYAPVAGMHGAVAQVIDRASAFQVTDILADPVARAPTFGLDSPLVTRGFAAVKTGTSKDMRDNWCLGFSDRYTVGVWVGNAGGEAMHRVSGTQGAAPVWRALLQRLHADAPSRPPRPPAGLVARTVVFEGRLEPPRREWLRAAAGGPAGPLQVRSGEQVARARPSGITQPRTGSVFALDPDMPAPVQRIRFSGEPGQWWLNGRPLGSGPQLGWAPWPGHHRLQLKTASGELIDEVRFEVRGAGLKPR